METGPLIEAAAAGDLPAWTEATPERREHMARVADLLEAWGGALGLAPQERARWRAVGFLHDALRDADPETLRAAVPPVLRALPPLLLHGPAAAQRLWVDGIRDGALLRAVAYHTLGHPELGRMGRFLYLADFLEPGRDLLNEWREGLRDRLPGDAEEVLREIVAARLNHLIGRGWHLRPETAAFWNSLARGD